MLDGMGELGRTEPARRTMSGPLARLIPVVSVLALMWAIEIIDAVPSVDLDQYGVRPRSSEGLIGVVTMPFLHGGFGHLIANSGAFLVLGSLIALTTQRFWLAMVSIAVIGGLGTWLIAQPHSIHIGASGVVYGFAAFLVTWGIRTRKILDILVAVGVIVVYGGLVIGVLPGQPGISWQGHLCGAIAGVLVAWWAAGRRRAPATYGQGPTRPFA